MRTTLLKPAWAIAVTAALSVALLGACKGDGTASPTTTTTTQAKSNTTTPLADPAGEAALQGYRAYWNAYLKSADPMDPENPLLVEHASGPGRAQGRGV